jgi:predicted CXXCH cytochrome family protein
LLKFREDLKNFKLRRNNNMKKILVVVTVLAIALVSSVAMAGIATTKHNLSSTGTGGYTANNTTEICVFCHTPHAAAVAQGPLWNRSAVDRNYTMYTIQTATAQTAANPLSPASKACMSCHDGATALNSIINKPGLNGAALTGSVTSALSTGDANIGETGGTNLSNDHPVAITYITAKASLRAPNGTIATGVTKVSGTNTVNGTTNVTTVMCESCHDVHTNTASFLRIANTGSSLCLACHMK